MVPPVLDKALNLLLVLHADHEQNCSTSTVRLVGSSLSNLFASVSAGVGALWGPLHGGANQKVIEMLERIRQDDGNFKKYVSKAKDKSDPFRLMGFGHRVYKNFDPRARILEKVADEVLTELGIDDPLLDIARNLERVALEDQYFVDHKLYPNVDFYSGILYRAMGIPTEMFTVMFALGRLPGWIAQWKELREGPGMKIGRPRQIYQGEAQRPFVPLAERDQPTIVEVPEGSPSRSRSSSGTEPRAVPEGQRCRSLWRRCNDAVPRLTLGPQWRSKTDLTDASGATLRVGRGRALY